MIAFNPEIGSAHIACGSLWHGLIAGDQRKKRKRQGKSEHEKGSLARSYAKRTAGTVVLMQCSASAMKYATTRSSTELLGIASLRHHRRDGSSP